MTVSIAVTNRASISTPKNVPEDGERADHDDHVVEQGHDRGHAELHVAEPVRDPAHDADRADDDQQQRLVDEVGRHDRADRRQRLLLGDRAELLLERAGDLAEPAGRGDRRVADRGRRRGDGEADGARGGAGRRATGSGLGTGMATGSAGPGLAEAARRRRGGGSTDGLGARGRRRARARGRRRARAPATGAPATRTPTAAASGRASTRPIGIVLISRNPSLGLDHRRLEALRREELADLGGLDVRVLELDDPARAAGVVDRELQAGVGERRQQDEEQSRDREEGGEEEEPAPLADDVKHARGPLPGGPPGRWAARRTRSRRRRSSRALRAQSWWTTSRSIVRLTVTAENIETSTPMIRTSAKPRMTDEPNRNRIEAVIRLDTFESRIDVPGPVEARLDRRRQRLADPQLLLHPLEDQDVRVDRHADRQDEARDAGQGQGHRDEPEDRVDEQAVVDQREARHDARQPVVDDHEQDHEGDRDRRRRAGSGGGTRRRGSR